MKVIVTGGNGRLGRFTVKELMSEGHDVVSIDKIVDTQMPCEAVSIDLGETEKLSSLFGDADAVIHLARVRFPYTENGFDPGSQTWKTPDVTGDAERFNGNVGITYKVLAAACQAEVKKVVLGSSLAVYGLYYPTSRFLPDYLPVDENHPLKPQDPYGLSKLVGESMATAFSSKSDMQIASLRFSGIYTEEMYPVLIERRKDPLVRGTGSLWSYVDARDAATACRLAMERSFGGHEVFNICAPKTVMKTATDELVRRYLPTVRLQKPDPSSHWTGYATEKAQKILGFTAVRFLDS